MFGFEEGKAFDAILEKAMSSKLELVRMRVCRIEKHDMLNFFRSGFGQECLQERANLR